MSAFDPLQTLRHLFILPCMNHRRILVLLPLVVLFGATPADAQVTDKDKQAAAIESECGLKKDTIAVTGDEIHLQPSPHEAYEKVDCALEKLNKAGFGKLGFVGNEADPNSVLRPPLSGWLSARAPR